MPRTRKRGRTAHYLSPSPSPRELSPQPIASVFQDSAAQSAMASSRPSSLAYLSSTITHPPTLHEILSNVAPAPWTQAAFMAFLSQNYCLETLEFTMEANRYTSAYSEIMAGQGNFKGNEGNDYLCELWQKLIGSYVVPDSFREVNIPARVRDRLLSLSAHGIPPHPSELDEAIRIVHELMNDCVLGAFLESVAVPQQEEAAADENAAGRQGRSRVRIPKESSSSHNEEASRSPKSSFLPHFGIHRSEHIPIPSVSTPTATPETRTSEGAWTPASPREEPMTPPTTPPTSDWGFSASPGTLQRAINAHNTGWKKMGQKLGLSRKSGRGKQSNSSVTSGVADSEEPHLSSRNSAVAADGAEPSQQQTGARPKSWEEPHPGVPLPLQGGSGMQALIRTPSGGWRGDMAAKGYGYFRTRSGVARRSERPGLRPRMTKSTRIIQQTGLEETDSETDYTTRGNEAAQKSQTPSPAESTACPTPAIITADDEVNGDAVLSGPETPPACDRRPLSLDISDFSHHIAKTLDGVHSNASSLTVCDVESFTRAAPEEDLYGWDAELKRKLEKGCGRTVVCSCLARDPVPRRRHASRRRNLLQRVFSGLGESRPRATE